uniref:Uncharacterized protein n=1 Tax=Streptomyces avermitilis TaxID=33903 RepID=A0A499VXP8_STRAX|nr:hypothetical protein SAVMC3_53850 [Streptomyces avermitilis]
MAVTAKPSRSSASWVASRMTSSSSTNRTWVCSAIRCSQLLSVGAGAGRQLGAGVAESVPPTALLYSVWVRDSSEKRFADQL